MDKIRHGIRRTYTFSFWWRLFLQAWDSALFLARRIFHQPSLVSNMKVLELGAGVGLPSFVSMEFAKKVRGQLIPFPYSSSCRAGLVSVRSVHGKHLQTDCVLYT